ncbi:MAG: hypothetical protein ABL971_06125 [Vicinamibacterales bacterium]
MSRWIELSGEAPDSAIGSRRPALSVVNIVIDTTGPRASVSHLASCLQALSEQVNAPPFEVVVPYHPDVDGMEALQQQFDWVRFVPVTDVRISLRERGGREHHDVLKTRGIALARGELIGLLEDHGRPDTHWCANVTAAHQRDCAAVGGAIENGIDRILNWAVYFCDFGRYQNPLPTGESPIASDANVTYKRGVLDDIVTIWEKSYREIVVNTALVSRSEKIVLQPDVIVHEQREGLRFGSALRERFIWGRSYAATRTAWMSGSQRIVYSALSPLLPLVLVLRMMDTARQRRRNFGKFLLALPVIAALVTVWSAGEAVGYVAGVRTRPASVTG